MNVDLNRILDTRHTQGEEGGGTRQRGGGDAVKRNRTPQGKPGGGEALDDAHGFAAAGTVAEVAVRQRRRQKLLAPLAPRKGGPRGRKRLGKGVERKPKRRKPKNPLGKNAGRKGAGKPPGASRKKSRLPPWAETPQPKPTPRPSKASSRWLRMAMRWV